MQSMGLGMNDCIVLIVASKQCEKSGYNNRENSNPVIYKKET